MKMDDSLTICGISGFELRWDDGRSEGGQHVGFIAPKIEIYHKDLGISASYTDRNQVKAREACIFMINSILEAKQEFSDKEIRDFVKDCSNISD